MATDHHFESLPKVFPALHDTDCDPGARARHQMVRAEVQAPAELGATPLPGHAAESRPMRWLGQGEQAMNAAWIGRRDTEGGASAVFTRAPHGRSGKCPREGCRRCCRPPPTRPHHSADHHLCPHATPGSTRLARSQPGRREMAGNHYVALAAREQGFHIATGRHKSMVKDMVRARWAMRCGTNNHYPLLRRGATSNASHAKPWSRLSTPPHHFSKL
jgi:hypothetical protein